MLSMRHLVKGQRQEAGANLRDRAKGSLWGLIVGDCLGSPIQFSGKDSHPWIADMGECPVFGLPPDYWTDDEAMAKMREIAAELALARLSTFASKPPAVAGVLLLGLHYTVDFAASAASLEIFGGGWAGNVSPSRSSRTARSGFGST